MTVRCTGHSPRQNLIRREDDQEVKFTGMECAASVLSGSREVCGWRFLRSAVSTIGGNGAAWAWDAQPAATWSPSQRLLPLLLASGLWFACLCRCRFSGRVNVQACRTDDVKTFLQMSALVAA